MWMPAGASFVRRFTSRHMCPILVQAAVFHINGAQTDTTMGGPLEPLRCLFCDDTFPITEELHQHILTNHRLRRYEFDASRDSVDAEGLACRHCSALFVRPGGLREHIANGRCPHFDANLAPVPIQADWTFHLKNGAIMTYLEDPEMKKQWNLVCLTCSKAFDRAQDLHAHINLEHSYLWEYSRPWLLVLLDTMSSQHGCICRSPIKQTRSARICPAFIQMAILLTRMADQLHVPWDVRDSDWATRTTCGLPTVNMSHACPLCQCVSGAPLTAGPLWRKWFLHRTT